MSNPVGMIYSLIPKIMSEVGAIEKTRTNKIQGYEFRGIDDVLSAFQEPLSKNGVFVAPRVIEHHREERTSAKGGLLIYTIVKMDFVFYTLDGSSLSVTTMGEAMDSGDKSMNKAMSAAMKYAFFQTFCVPTNDDSDTESNSPDPLPKSKVKPEQPKPKDGNQGMDVGYRVPFGKFSKRSLEEIPLEDLKNYVVYLEDKAEKENKPLQGVVADFIDRAVNYVGSLENSESGSRR